MIKAVVNCILLAISLVLIGCESGNGIKWQVHDMRRPEPRVIDPGPIDGMPSDAIILFDGSNLNEWESVKGGDACWKVAKGYMEVVAKRGSIQTKRSFGDCQLHVEWATAGKVSCEGQHRSNSGVFLMGLYELQVLDSFESSTYPDGQAGAIYGQKPPLVNVCRGPGEWQSYDVVFHRPIFKGSKIVKPATMTAFQNGVLVQDNYQLKGKTKHKKEAFYEVHADKLPLQLQDHKDAVRYRNIWIREIGAQQ
jgi:hypothetical protein